MCSTDRRRGHGGSSGALGRLLVLVAALAGLFAMHGLSEHGVAGDGGLALASTGVAESHAKHPAPAPGAEHGDHGAPSEHGHALTGLCLALLAAAGLLISAVRRTRARRARDRSVLRARLLGPRVRWRTPDPPDLYRLSVQRC